MLSRTEQAPGEVVDILMYHSISDADGPTSTPETVFSAQMQAIADAGVKVISLDEFLAWKYGKQELSAPAIVLTFDDGFDDFASAAWPIIRGHGWPVTVFLPTDHIGSQESWRGSNEPPRSLMSWGRISQLARQGVDFGGHSTTHSDLNTLSESDLEAELRGCKDAIEARTGREARHFAPPYGLASQAVRQVISRHFVTSCGTRLGRADKNSDLFDLPRLEMYYFTDRNRWRAQLDGHGAKFLAARTALRAVREALSKPWHR